MTYEEKTVDKIKKLLDHANSAEQIGNAEEAQAFMNKVQSLCNKHRIDIAEAEMFDPGNEDSTIDRENCRFKWGEKYRSRKRVWWSEQLASLISKNNNCTHYIFSGSNSVGFIGRERDRQIAIYLWKYIVRTITDFAQKEYDRVYNYHYDRGTQSECRGWKKAFLTGFVQGVSEQYTQMARELKVEVGNEKYALITTDQLTIVQNWKDENCNFGSADYIQSGENSNDGAYNAGIKKGLSTSLNANGVTGGSNTVKQIG